MPPSHITPEDRDTYMNGFHNRLIRYYYYLQSGLDVLSQFRNLFIAIAAVYVTLKLDGIGLAIGMFFVSCIVLTAFGYYKVHHLAKIQEFVAMKFSTHFSIQTFNYQKDQTELLKKILEELEKRNVV